MSRDRDIAFKVMAVVGLLGGATVGHEGEVIDMAIDELLDIAATLEPDVREVWDQGVNAAMASIGGGEGNE